MTGEITAQSIFVADTMLPGFRWHWHRRRLWFAGTVVCLYGLNLLVAFRNSAGDVSAGFWMDQIPLLLSFAICFILGHAFERWHYLRSLRHLPAYGKMLRWKIMGDGLECRLKDFQSFTGWSLVYESIATPEGALVYLQKNRFYWPPNVATPDGALESPQKNLFHWLPKTAFTSEPDYQRFLELLKAETKHSTVG